MCQAQAALSKALVQDGNDTKPGVAAMLKEAVRREKGALNNSELPAAAPQDVPLPADE